MRDSNPLPRQYSTTRIHAGVTPSPRRAPSASDTVLLARRPLASMNGLYHSAFSRQAIAAIFAASTPVPAGCADTHPLARAIHGAANSANNISERSSRDGR